MYLTGQKRNLLIKVLEEIIQDYYLFIPIAILNEAIDLPEFKNKYKKMYDQIILLKEIKKDLKEL